MSQSQLPWVVELVASPIPQPIRAQFEKRLVIGRSDKATNFRPDVDLSPYHADVYGISRQHAALVANASQLMIVDLNSGNGTYLNGVKLSPHEETPLRSQDRLQLGKMPMEVKVLIAPSYPVGFYKDVSMQMSETVGKGAGQTILLVQTDEDVSRVLTGALEGCGFKVIVAHNVVTAIRMFTQRHPSALLLDWTLPDMPGAELCRYVRRDTNYHMTPLVVITKEKKTVVVDEALDAGADVVLAEPLSIKEVQHIVTTLVGQQEQGASTFNTRHLVGTAPLQAIQPQTRRNSIVLFVSGSKEPMVLTVSQPVTFGRSVSQNLQFHVDLSRNNAADNGVSRMHARLVYENRTFYIEDLNSVNGTYLNGDPLEPGLKTPIRNADELRFGRLRAYAYFLEDSDKPE